MESVVLGRVEWLSSLRDALNERQSGFRRSRFSAADALGDVVSLLKQARHEEEGAYLLLLDVKSAFDGLPHQAIRGALGGLRIQGRLRAYVNGFIETVRCEYESARP